MPPRNRTSARTEDLQSGQRKVHEVGHVILQQFLGSQHARERREQRQLAEKHVDNLQAREIYQKHDHHSPGTSTGPTQIRRERPSTDRTSWFKSSSASWVSEFGTNLALCLSNVPMWRSLLQKPEAL